MRQFLRSFSFKITLLFCVLVSTLAAAYAYTLRGLTARLESAADQRVNWYLARSIAAELQHYLEPTLNRTGVMQVLQSASKGNPWIGIYLLDQEGLIIAEPGTPEMARRNRVALEPLRLFLKNSRKVSPLVSGDNPQAEQGTRPISVWPVSIQGAPGYLYVVLGNERHVVVQELIASVFHYSSSSFLIVFLGVTAIGVVLFAFLTRELREMTAVVKRYQNGFLSERITVRSEDDIGELARSINDMAARVEQNIDLLRSADTLRRELVSNISHDLRTPLASIQGYVETLQLKEDILSPSERSRYLAIVFDEAAYLGHLITDLFELSKIEASHESPKREIFPISDLAQDVLQKFEPLAAKSGIRLALDVQGSRHEVFADIALMERVLSNLVDNAVRHSFIEGQVTLSVRELSNGVEVRVTDCGSGIPTQEQSRIFERFYRVPGQRGDRTMGSGLGLAIVKSILDKHEIAIQVSSAEGHGTSFFWMLERP